MPDRPVNIKMFPDEDVSAARADRFVSEMTVHKTLESARMAIAARAQSRAEAREARRHAAADLMQG